jgi:hypothetical protein
MAAAEQKKSYKVVKEFKGVNTKANRTAIDENEFSWLENAQPVGYANIKAVNARKIITTGAGANVTFSNNVNYFTSVNLNNTDYILAFKDNGSAEYFDISNAVLGNVASAGTFSTSGIQATQWKDDRTLILDPAKGYYTWNGNNVVFIGSVGVIAITNAGSGYTSAPTVTISAPNDSNGVQALAVSTITANAVSSITLTEAGSGYNAAPTITIAGGGGSNAAAIASYVTFATGTVAVVVTNGGTGYTNAANTTVSITGGGGTNAAGTAVLSGGQVQQVVMTNVGSGYSNSANLSVTITGGGGSNATAKGIINSANNVGIASFSGRVWIAYGRTVAYTAADSYSDFTSVSAGNQLLTDSTLHGNIQQIISANNFLYVFGDDSINVFSDVRVTSTGSTIFTNTNVSASVGTRRKEAIFPYFRSILFLNDYGIYALVGSTTSKLSDSLDGVFPYIDFTYPITGGQVLVNNILCAAFNFRQNYYGSLRYVQAVFFEKKWFFTSQGDELKYVTSAPVAGGIKLYGIDNNTLYNLYGNATSNSTSVMQTALNSMGDPIRDKQALKIGVEATLSNSGVLSVTVDSENNASPVYALSNFVTWTNNVGNTIQWANATSIIINWSTSTGYQLYKTDAQQWGKYLGMTVTSNYPGFTINGFEYEHELRARF